MAVQIVSSNTISTRDLAIKLANNMGRIATIVNDTFVQSNIEIQRILNSGKIFFRTSESMNCLYFSDQQYCFSLAS
jgi:hypothetical protein